MTKYEYLQNKIDEITTTQIKLNKILEESKQKLIENRDSLTIKEAEKKAGIFWKLK